MDSLDYLLDRFAELSTQEKALEGLSSDAAVQALLNRIRSNREAKRLEIKRLLRKDIRVESQVEQVVTV